MWETLNRSLKRGVLAGLSAAMPPGGVEHAPHPREADVEALGQALRVEIHRLFRRSMRARHLDAGSCNGCESEITALLNPFYDLQRFGLDIVASPRHADALLVTGPVSRHLEDAVRRTDDATPRPRLVIAVGDCACHGGFCAGSFATLEGVEAVLPVDVRIPGCPPEPAAILRGLLAGIGRLEALPQAEG